MKKFLMGLLGFVFGWGGLVLTSFLIFGIVEGNVGEEIKTLLILTVISFVVMIIGFVMKHKAKYTCWCGGKGKAVDAEYVGKDVRYDDTNSGFSKTTSKKYVLTVQCEKCGKQWGVKTSKNTTEYHHFN